MVLRGNSMRLSRHECKEYLKSLETKTWTNFDKMMREIYDICIIIINQKQVTSTASLNPRDVMNLTKTGKYLNIFWKILDYH
ncbi:hypothetical protein BpHYR1_015546 [Brachionus plicatilis]|uniref:Uncharacterized protein n=1 Tax=Brachionus plicatilis TaxID=10195 RepID=A0A3M7Q913_BRAPC|nr:hypothetical protein BpHYR1_015546 [Brachionus plicatilis]